MSIMRHLKISGVRQMQTADWHFFSIYCVTLPILRANCKQANQNAVQANRSTIQANRNVI